MYRPFFTGACNILSVFNRRSTKIMTQPAEHRNFSLPQSCALPFETLSEFYINHNAELHNAKVWRVMQTSYLTFCFYPFKKFDEILLLLSYYLFCCAGSYRTFLFLNLLTKRYRDYVDVSDSISVTERTIIFRLLATG